MARDWVVRRAQLRAHWDQGSSEMALVSPRGLDRMLSASLNGDGMVHDAHVPTDHVPDRLPR